MYSFDNGTVFLVVCHILKIVVIMKRIILFGLTISLVGTIYAMDKKTAPIAAYLMSVVNATSKDFRISYMFECPEDPNKLKRKPLYVVPPRTQKIFEKDLAAKQIKMLKLDPSVLPEAYYLFIENLYDENDGIYLQISRYERDTKALILGELKQKIHHANMHSAPILETLEPFDPNIGSTTMVSIIFDDEVLKNLKVQFNSRAGIIQ